MATKPKIKTGIQKREWHNSDWSIDAMLKNRLNVPKSRKGKKVPIRRK